MSLIFSVGSQAEIKGVSNVEKVLLETADGVTEVKRKLEFGIQQIIFKVSFIEVQCLQVGHLRFGAV